MSDATTKATRVSIHKALGYPHCNMGEDTGIHCPCCEGDYNHESEPYVISGEDNYRAGWGGRGDLTIIPFWGECGSEWDLCVGFHKGCCEIFVRVRTDCRNVVEEPS